MLEVVGRDGIPLIGNEQVRRVALLDFMYRTDEIFIQEPSGGTSGTCGDVVHHHPSQKYIILGVVEDFGQDSVGMARCWYQHLTESSNVCYGRDSLVHIRRNWVEQLSGH